MKKTRVVINLPAAEPWFVPVYASRFLLLTSRAALLSARRCRSRLSATRSDRVPAASTAGTDRPHPTEHFEQVSASSAKHKHVPGKWVLLQLCLCQTAQPRESSS